MGEQIDNALEKLDATFNRLQSLNILPTLSNMETLVQSLYEIREVYQFLKTLKGEDDGRA